MPFHVRITPRSGRHRGVRLDLSAAELEAAILRPYRLGRLIVVGGWTIAPADIERIQINYTDEPSRLIAPIVRDQPAPAGDTDPLPAGWLVAAFGEDVTDRYVTDPPGGIRPADDESDAADPDPRRVFVVHGRNLAAKDAMFTFLRAIGLDPIEWAEAILATGRPSPYLGQILTAAFEQAQAVVVLFTPDDVASLRPAFQDPGDPPHETQPTGQARPNVLFEAGMAMGRSEARTVLVELGALRPFSDVAGRHMVHLSDSSQRRQELAQRLQAAGCEVRLTGTDWHRAGAFGAAVGGGPVT